MAQPMQSVASAYLRSASEYRKKKILLTQSARQPAKNSKSLSDMIARDTKEILEKHKELNRARHRSKEAKTEY